MKNFLKAFIRDERGLAAVEYAIVGGLIVGALVTAFTSIGTNAATKLGQLAAALT